MIFHRVDTWVSHLLFPFPELLSPEPSPMRGASSPLVQVVLRNLRHRIPVFPAILYHLVTKHSVHPIARHQSIV